ncbi:thioredoxin reductase (NADPH) [Geomicrobium halophilum]|uniref:Thioredoxin reductase (NADPH) n=1 Tax=Geomicrobium halophilum TaxID=549000 RepID=A0A841PU04_9BACL|nr:FAD-dependent oxidoreductase [Geomicrobium halophilum]MBB6449781.1 thioredoxin reductase (NADPH) [Geomicrobium halophilum]
MNKHRVSIIGTGPAGLTAAIYLARANMNPVIIEGVEPGGQLTTTTEVENFPGFIEGITGPELMDNMRKQAERFGATCDGFFYNGKKVVVIGGGDSAMEEANFLTKFADEVVIVHRRHELRASKIMQDRANENPKISWQMNQSAKAYVANEQGIIQGLKIIDNDSGEEKTIETNGIFVAIGHNPNTEFLEDALKKDAEGYLQVEPGTTKTNIAGVFACGDVQDVTYKQAVTAAGTECMAALDTERFLEGEATLDWSKSLS